MKKIILLITLMSASITFAQWNPDTGQNLLVANGTASIIAAEGTSTGETYVVYWKQVGVPVNYELRMQILDVDGNRTLGDDGMLISADLSMATYTVLSSAKVDADDNIYIAVTATDGVNSVYAYKFDSSGNELWRSNAPIGFGNKPVVLGLDSGESVFSWLSDDGALMKKFDANGTEIWDTPKPISLPGFSTIPDNFFKTSNGFVALFHKPSYSIYSTLYAQRYDADGNGLWNNPVQLTEGSTTWNRYYEGIVENDILFVGYFASSDNRFDSYVQRLNPDGTLPWGINGADIDSSQNFLEMDTSIAISSDYIWAVGRFTNSSQSTSGTFVQKINKTSGGREFSNQAKEIFGLGMEKSPAGELRILDGHPVFLIADGSGSGTGATHLHAVMLDDEGNFVWENETKPIATFDASKGNVGLMSPYNSSIVAIFEEDKGDGNKIYAQNLVEEIVGIQEMDSIEVFISNPIAEELFIQADFPIYQVRIFDMLGRKVATADGALKTSMIMNTASLSTGTFIIQIADASGGVKIIKVIKK